MKNLISFKTHLGPYALHADIPFDETDPSAHSQTRGAFGAGLGALLHDRGRVGSLLSAFVSWDFTGRHSNKVCTALFGKVQQ